MWSFADAFGLDSHREGDGEILENIKKYDVDVIEVVGHTDEQPIGAVKLFNQGRLAGFGLTPRPHSSRPAGGEVSESYKLSEVD